MFSLNITGIKDLQDAFAKVTDDLTKNAKTSVTNTANAIAESAKQNCTGKLADSITTDIANDGMSATVSTNDPNAAPTEYGTAEHAPKPFLNPAAEANMQTLLGSLSI